MLEQIRARYNRGMQKSGAERTAHRTDVLQQQENRKPLLTQAQQNWRRVETLPGVPSFCCHTVQLAVRQI